MYNYSSYRDEINCMTFASIDFLHSIQYPILSSGKYMPVVVSIQSKQFTKTPPLWILTGKHDEQFIQGESVCRIHTHNAIYNNLLYLCEYSVLPLPNMRCLLLVTLSWPWLRINTLGLSTPPYCAGVHVHMHAHTTKMFRLRLDVSGKWNWLGSPWTEIDIGIQWFRGSHSFHC